MTERGLGPKKLKRFKELRAQSIGWLSMWALKPPRIMRKIIGRSNSEPRTKIFKK